MPTGRHLNKEHHHKHVSKHEMHEKMSKHRHKVPGYIARELAKTDVPKAIQDASQSHEDQTKH